MKIKKWKDEQIPGACQKAEKVEEHEAVGNTNCSWCPSNGLQRPWEKFSGTGDQRQNWDHPSHSSVKIS